jgi:preprotein translocase subunit SecE
MTQKKNVAKSQKKSGSTLDVVKWLFVILLICAGLVANSYYQNQVAWALRAAGGIVVAAIAIAVALQTVQGQSAWNFIKGARVELRKVVWPTRQETLQTTLIVVLMVVVTALILWGLDSVFLWGVGWLTGQRG